MSLTSAFNLALKLESAGVTRDGRRAVPAPLPRRVPRRVPVGSWARSASGRMKRLYGGHFGEYSSNGVWTFLDGIESAQCCQNLRNAYLDHWHCFCVRRQTIWMTSKVPTTPIKAINCAACIVEQSLQTLIAPLHSARSWSQALSSCYLHVAFEVINYFVTVVKTVCQRNRRHRAIVPGVYAPTWFTQRICQRKRRALNFMKFLFGAVRN